MSNISVQRQVARLVEGGGFLGAHSEAPFKIKNSLAGHPLFEDNRLKRLLRMLPREQVEIRAVQLLGADDGCYRRGELLKGADPVDVFERLAEEPAWMLLHESWIHDPEYAELMRQYVRDLSETITGVDDDISDLGCWLFLSSGKCVVHFHADPDQSFLNQIRGYKTVFVYPTKILPELTVERLVYTGNQGVVTYEPEYEAAMFPPVPLAPGETVFLPLFAPHRVINDGGISVSINVGFQTRESRRRRNVHLVNLEMRGLGLRPSPFNLRPAVDSVKQRMVLAIHAKNKLFRSLRPEVPL
jgi:hypothetical protein